MMPFRIYFLVILFTFIPLLAQAKGYACVGKNDAGQTINLIYDTETATIKINKKIYKIEKNNKKIIYTKVHMENGQAPEKLMLVYDKPNATDVTMFQVNANTKKIIAKTSLVCRHYHKQFSCFAGKISNSLIKNINEIRIGITNDPHKSSLIVFYNHKIKYSTDIFCKKNHIGRCALLDDSGSFEILTYAADKMTIQFNGMPMLAKKNESIVPSIDSQVKLTSPIRMNLTVRPSIDCSY